MKTKSHELSGAALDWAVAYAIGGDVRNYPAMDGAPHWEARGEEVSVFSNPPGTTYRPRIGWIGEPHPAWKGDTRWRPSTDWNQGGPLIDKHIVYMDSHHEGEEKYAVSREPIRYRIGGPTYLVAAMRSIVRANLGDEVDVPEEFS